jgi:uncharacterized protein (DUF2252 family)
LYFYVIPDQEDDVVLGKSWMVADDVMIRPARGLIYIGVADHWVKERKPNQQLCNPEVRQQTGSVFAALIRRGGQVYS